MTMSTDQLQMVRVPIGQLRPHAMNPRRGNVKLLVESLLGLEQYRPVIVNRGTMTGRPNEILAGHHLVLAATELGWDDIVCAYVDVDDEKATRILLMDNRSNDLAGYDDRLLAELLETLPNLDYTGYTEEDRAAIVKLLEVPILDPDGGDQDILDDSDEAMWPEIRCRLAPPLYAMFQALPGQDDAGKLAQLLQDGR